MTNQTGTTTALSGLHVVDTKQAARYLGLSPNTLEAWRSRGGGPRFVKYPRAVRYRVADLEAYMADGERSNTSEVLS